MTSRRNLLNMRFLLSQYQLIIGLLVAGLGAAVLAGFGISLVLPVLGGLGSDSLGEAPGIFNNVVRPFQGMPVARRLQIVALLFVGVTLVKAVLLFVSVLLAARLQIYVVKHSRIETIKQLLRIGMGHFNSSRGSDFQIMISDSTTSTAGAIVMLLGNALTQFIMFLLLIVMMVLLSWQLTLIAGVLVTVASFSSSFLSKMMSGAGQELIQRRNAFNKVLFDIINGKKVIHLFNRERSFMKDVNREVNNFNNSLYKVVKINGAVAPLFEIIGVVTIAVILFSGSFILPKGDSMQLGVLMTFLVILSRIMAPVKVLNQARVKIIEKLPALRELNDFLDLPTKTYLKNGATTFNGLRSGIEFRNLTFGYNPEEAIVLENISFKIKKGSKVGVAGHSGSGKSTLVELLLRFYDPQSGSLLVDGTDLRDIDWESWRRFIGVVSQDTFLFNETVRDNIAFAKPSASQEEVERAARRAHAHDFIAAMPKGYNTYLGDRGVRLSGGQRQRIAIARAILIEPEILIFDEATSSLDTQSERIVQNALDDVGKGKTVITIAHRLSTIADSDNILVFDRGQIIERGSHQDLIKNEGVYSQLVKKQQLVEVG